VLCGAVAWHLNSMDAVIAVLCGAVLWHGCCDCGAVLCCGTAPQLQWML